MEAASLPFSLGWEVEGEEGGQIGLVNVPGVIVFGLVGMHGTGPEVVMRARYKPR